MVDFSPSFKIAAEGNTDWPENKEDAEKQEIQQL
jgi:hypothetical protein